MAGYPPDWTDPTKTATPKFTATYTVEASSSIKGVGAMACRDVNGDGHVDFLILRCTSGSNCATPGRADLFLGNGHGSFSKSAFTSPLSAISGVNKDGTHIAFLDYNRDGKIDLLIGLATTKNHGNGASATGGGKVIALLNNGAAVPQWNTQVQVLDNILLDDDGASSIAVADFSNDGIGDLVVEARVRATPSCTKGWPAAASRPPTPRSPAIPAVRSPCSLATSRCTVAWI